VVIDDGVVIRRRRLPPSAMTLAAKSCVACDATQLCVPIAGDAQLDLGVEEEHGTAFRGSGAGAPELGVGVWTPVGAGTPERCRPVQPVTARTGARGAR
jgi:hypothetical protein